MIAIWTTALLIAAAFGAAMTYGWKRSAAQPIKQEHDICGPTCYPRIKR
ncbi:MAG: hypothetical protein KDK10_02985 [Maritimibacter sp.]|nr:hypothetical protein [Maritimibacter sp.]